LIDRDILGERKENGMVVDVAAAFSRMAEFGTVLDGL
jgi:hypothetical protein